MKKASCSCTKQVGLMFFFFFIANCVVIYLGHILFPSQIVLGTYFHTVLMAMIYSMLVLTLFMVGADMLLICLVERTKAKLSELHKTVLYFLLNFVGVWVVARLATMLGLGISSWLVALGLAIVFGLAQRALVKTIVERA